MGYNLKKKKNHCYIPVNNTQFCKATILHLKKKEQSVSISEMLGKVCDL